MFNAVETSIPGCYEIHPNIFEDNRGRFTKVFDFGEFAKIGLNGDFVEQYYSISMPHVIRGLHFQIPPHEHDKLVYCVAGSVFDVALDLRQGSPAYGKHCCVELDAKKANMLYLPSGIAHGFCTREDPATVIYNVTSIHHPESDVGIRWDSANIEWPGKSHLISPRDAGFCDLGSFKSPFFYNHSI